MKGLVINYPKVKYSATKIVMNTKRIHHRKFGFKLMPIMQVWFSHLINFISNYVENLFFGSVFSPYI